MDQFYQWLQSDGAYRAILFGGVGVVLTTIFQIQRDLRLLRDEVRKMRIEIINSR